MKKVLFLTLTMSSLASAASPWLSMASKRAPKAFGLLVGHGLATGLVDHCQTRLQQGQLFDLLNTAMSQNSNENATAGFAQRIHLRQAGVSLLGKLKRIIFMRGVGVTAGHLSNNKLVGSIGRWVPFVALPTTFGMVAMSYLPGCDWITEKVIDNQYVESALWGLAAGCIALNKSTK